jgi:hypothetical protein
MSKTEVRITLVLSAACFVMSLGDLSLGWTGRAAFATVLGAGLLGLVWIDARFGR